MAEFWEENLILRVVCGSRAQGLATESSDLDTRGICIPPKRFLIGLSRFEQHQSAAGDDVTYSLAKFVRLALEGNPNIIETLFTEPEDVLHVDAYGRRLVDSRHFFLSKKVGERFMGYAVSQLRRIERHYRWLKEPPERQPTPDEFGAEGVPGRYEFPNRSSETAYRAALKHWQHYQRWRRHRHPARAALEERHGYDTKHASHLCRLLKMGHEILAQGVVRVRRPDAEWLRGVRGGAMSYEELLEWAERRIEALPELMRASPLPDEPRHEEAEALVVELHESFHFGGGIPISTRRPVRSSLPVLRPSPTSRESGSGSPRRSRRT